MPQPRDHNNRLDWVHPPSGVQPISLRETLHDGSLLAMAFDPAARSVRFDFETSHLQLKASITIQTISELRITGWKDNLMLSMSEDQFQRALQAATQDFDIQQAALLQEEGDVALMIGGMLDGDRWTEIFAHGTHLEFNGVDSLESFLAPGRAYWDAFGNLSPFSAPGEKAGDEGS